MNAQTSSTLPVQSVNFSEWLNPSCTYFRTSDVTPMVSDDGQTITMVNGRGTSRSWGSPKVTSIATRLSETVIMVEVTGWHKHSVGPEGGNYYFVREGEKWVRRTANAKAVKAVLH
mgnify:CR=1 FL=1